MIINYNIDRSAAAVARLRAGQVRQSAAEREAQRQRVVASMLAEDNRLGGALGAQLAAQRQIAAGFRAAA